MLYQMPIRFALVALMATAPAPGPLDAAFAGSSSRSETRHNLTDEGASEVRSTRSNKRRATRSSGASEETQVTQNRGKRSRRAPAGATTEPTVIAKAETVETDFVALAAASGDDIAKHIRLSEFEGPTGILAIYQLTGKAAADMPLTPSEMKALTKLTEETDLATIIEKTETHLINATGDAAMLDAIAEALGVPRPTADAAMQSNLGASLVVGDDANNG